MTVWLLVVVAAATWVAMANAYFAASEGSGLRGPGVRRTAGSFGRRNAVVLVVNAVRGVAEAPSVVSFTARERCSVLIGGAVAAAGVLAVSGYAKHVEKTIDAPFRKRR